MTKTNEFFKAVATIMGIVIVCGVVAFGFVYLHEQRQGLNDEIASLRAQVEAFSNVSDEILLYKQIEDQWFSRGSDYMDQQMLRELSFMTYKYHQKYGSNGEIPIGLDYWRILAWVDIESRFNPEAESYAGAIGLTQHMFITGVDGLDRYFDLQGLSKQQVLDYLYNPVWSLRLGLERLVDYQTDFIATGVASDSDWKLTFSLYNWSTQAVSNLMSAIEGGTPKASLKYALDVEKKMKTFMDGI